jgi:hypothetical protein
MVPTATTLGLVILCIVSAAVMEVIIPEIAHFHLFARAIKPLICPTKG